LTHLPTSEMADQQPSRRDFLGTAGAAFGAVWLVANLPALHAAGAHAALAVREGVRSFDFFSLEEADDVEALAALIFPTTETPGAHEAGVIHFIDRALGSFMSAAAQPVRTGLIELNATVARQTPGATRFALLPTARQAAVLRALESTPFFGLIRFLTVVGMFANSSYGGNRDNAGWKLLGFEDHFAYQPPFGYYDRDAHEGDG
jgi:gluconate 2-dehydrogenase gamma chain